MSSWGNKYELVLSWDAQKAEPYWILNREYTETFEWRTSYKSMKPFHTGDKEWAERNAKHYKIEMPLPKEQLNPLQENTPNE